MPHESTFHGFTGVSWVLFARRQKILSKKTLNDRAMGLATGKDGKDGVQRALSGLSRVDDY
ncbi:hypothetical protein N7456_000695 [Penicillium angulare]|uniref:Uncharacterized protein n=1 Tax=Penicillium angulare TaxID=116970 RepID=A0A9W9GD14_9EURO|nr:hypothetical protein N7456_000695 [Penicillium angulare]